MAERAAHLVDRVLPDVPVRQWVLTLPHACDTSSPGATISAAWWSASSTARSNATCAAGRDATVCAMPGAAAWPSFNDSDIDVAEILATIVAGVHRLLSREGLDEDGAVDSLADPAPLLAGSAAVPLRHLAPAPDAGAPGRPTAAPRVACHAQWDGYDPHAGVRVAAGHRDRLERVCRYALRPALTEGRLARTSAGEVAVQLRRPWADGTLALVFTPTAFLARLAMLVPRPRVNLLLYHGVLAPRAAGPSEVVPPRGLDATTPPETADARRGGRGWRWADLMRRVFAVDVLACPRCGGRLRLLATLAQSDITRRILRHLGLPIAVPPPAPPRAPPSLDDWAA